MWKRCRRYLFHFVHINGTDDGTARSPSTGGMAQRSDGRTAVTGVPFCRREEAVNIDILAVGKLRESFWREASQEYCKRLGRYAKIQICEAEEVKKPDVIPPGLEKQILEKEAERLRKFYKNGAYRIALAIDGQMLDSVQLSEKLENCMLTGHDTVQFIIGGAIGLDPSLLREADLRLSFSKMTFPHQLMRVILLEQVYRSFRIMRGEPYHK